MSQVQLSKEYIERLKKNEGWRASVYKDSEGYDTIGYGHKLTAADKKSGRFNKPLTKEEGEALLMQDAQEHAIKLFKKLPWAEEKPSNVQEVLLDMSYNMGIGGLLSFKNTLNNIKNDNYEAAARGIMNSKYARQVGKRASRNVDILLKGADGAITPAVEAPTENIMQDTIYIDESPSGITSLDAPMGAAGNFSSTPEMPDVQVGTQGVDVMRQHTEVSDDNSKVMFTPDKIETPTQDIVLDSYNPYGSDAKITGNDSMIMHESESSWIKPSTFKDNLYISNPYAIQFTHPELRVYDTDNKSDMSWWNYESTQKVYNQVDYDTQIQLSKAQTKEEFDAIVGRRALFTESARRVANDQGGVEAFAKNTVAGMIQPESIIPFAGAGGSFLKSVGVASLYGATLGAEDAALFKAQGLDGNVIEQTIMGAVGGGALGGLSHGISYLLVGPKGEKLKEDLTDDEITTNMDRDPNLRILETEEDVVTPKVETVIPAKVEKKWPEYAVGFLDKWLDSDASIVMRSDSDYLRTFFTKIASTTHSVRDLAGNLLPARFNMGDAKEIMYGLHNNAKREFEEAFNEAKKNKTFNGSYDDYVKEVSTEYTRLANEQEIKVGKESDALYAEVELEIKAEKKAAKAEVDAEIAYVKDRETGKERPMTEEEATLAEQGHPIEVIIKKRPKKERKELKKKIDDEYKEKLWEAKKKTRDELYAKHKVEFDPNNPIHKGTQAWADYFRYVGEKGNKAGVQAMQDITLDRLYRPRVWNFKDIHGKKFSDEYIFEQLRRGLAAHPNQSKLNAQELDELTKTLMEDLKKSSFDLNFLTSSRVIEKELPFSKKLASRKIKIDESKVGDLIIHNLEDTSAAYSHHISPRVAFAEIFGHDDINLIRDEFKSKLYEEGKATEAEIKAMEHIIEDQLNTLRMNQASNNAQWTFTRNFNSFQDLRLGGVTGMNQVVELAANLMLNGFTNMIKTGRIGKSWKNAAKLLYTKGEMADEFTQTLIYSGYLNSALRNHRANRVATGESGFNINRFESTMDWATDKFYKLNGLRYFTTVMEDWVGGAIIVQIKGMAKKTTLTDGEKARLARWGLTHEKVKKLNEDIEKHTNMAEGKFDLTSFTPENKQALQVAINRGISENVIQHDSIHMPNWMKTAGVWGKLATKFMTYPMIAHNVLLKRGIREDHARMASSMAASTLTFMGLNYLREQAALSLGLIDEGDTKYDYFDPVNGDDAIYNGIMGSMNYQAVTGMLTPAWNAGMVLTGNPELGRNYSGSHTLAEAIGGPSLGTINDIGRVAKDIAQGDFGEQTVKRIKRNTPAANLPIVKELLDMGIENTVW